MKNIQSTLILLGLLFMGGMLSAQVGAEFEIRNGVQNGNLYEFDVFMRADQMGTYHSRGLVYLSYNTDAFGMAMASNGQLVVTPGPLLNSPDPAGNPQYVTQNITDNNSNTFAIDWRSNYPTIAASSTFHKEVTLTYEKLYHISMPMMDPTAVPNLRFTPSLMQGEQYFITAATQSEVAYVAGGLPVVLLSFDGKKLKDGSVQLDWATSIEINNSHFEIEKAMDNGDFEKVGRVNGAGNSTRTNRYDFTDYSTMAALNSYRLKQVDLDGAVTYSEVVNITFDELGETLFSVYPTPAVSTVTLEASQALEGDYKLTLSDLEGRIVWTGQMDQDASAGKMTIDVSKLAAGTYYLKSTFKTSHFNTIVKQ